MVLIQNRRAQSLTSWATKPWIQCCSLRRRRLHAITALVLFLLVWFIDPFPKRPASIDPSTLQWKFPVANFTSSNAKRTIFLLSMGQEAAESTIVERSLLSIRRRGIYLGPVVVLTDAPLHRYSSLTNADPNLIVLQPKPQDWRWNLNQDMPYKRFKTYILEYLELDHRLHDVELVYYLDVDVVVGRPLQPWFDHVESEYLPQKHNHPSQLIFFKGNYRWRPLQGGQIVVDRRSSQPCLEHWRHFIDAHPEDPKDQSALTLILNEQNISTSVCHLTIMPQSPYLQFLDKKVMNRLINSQEYTTLMHIKNTEHADWIPNRIQQRFFKQLLMLSDEEQKVVGKAQIHPSKTWSASSSIPQQQERQ